MTPKDFEKSIDVVEARGLCPVTRQACLGSDCEWWYKLLGTCAFPAIADRLDLLAATATEAQP